MSPDQRPLKAYRVWWSGTRTSAEFAASTRGRATYAAYRMIRAYVTHEIGAPQDVRLNQFRTVRAPEYDDLAQSRQDGQAIFSRDLVVIAYDWHMLDVGYLC